MESTWKFTPARNELLRNVLHKQIVPRPCPKTGCKAPDGGHVAGGMSCNKPEDHGQVVSEASVWARLRVFHEQAKLSGPIDLAFYKQCLNRWKILCKGCSGKHDDGPYAHSNTTM